MSGEQPSTTQSTGDIKSHDDVTNMVSGYGVSTSLRKASSDAYPATGGGHGARRRDNQRSPTSGAHCGRRTSKPVAITHSAPEAAAAAAAAAAATSAVAASRPMDCQFQHGDQPHPHSSDSEEHLKEEHRKKAKKHITSPWTRLIPRDSWDCTDTTSNSVVVLEPLTVNPPPDFATSYGQASDGTRTTVGTSESSRRRDSQVKPRSFAATSTYSRQQCAGEEDLARRKVKSEGQKLNHCLSNCLVNSGQFYERSSYIRL